MYLAESVAKRSGNVIRSIPTDKLKEALAAAEQKKAVSRTVVILRDSEGADHPDNTGKWFLHQIVK
jgi:hypothetical protein